MEKNDQVKVGKNVLLRREGDVIWLGIDIKSRISGQVATEKGNLTIATLGYPMHIDPITVSLNAWVRE